MPSTTIGGAPVTTAHYARFSASLVSGLVDEELPEAPAPGTSPLDDVLPPTAGGGA